MKPKPKYPKGQPPFIYIYIYSRVKEKAKYSPYIGPRVLLEVLRRIVRIPKMLEYPILAQMEEHGLIEKINQRKYKICVTDIDKTLLPKLKNYAFW